MNFVFFRRRTCQMQMYIIFIIYYIFIFKMNVKIVCIGVTRDCYQCIIGNISFTQYVRIKLHKLFYNYFFLHQITIGWHLRKGTFLFVSPIK